MDGVPTFLASAGIGNARCTTSILGTKIIQGGNEMVPRVRIVEPTKIDTPSR